MSLYSYEYQQTQTSALTHDQRIRKILIRSAAALFSLFIVLLSSFLLTNINNYTATPVSAQPSSPISTTSVITSTPTQSTPASTSNLSDNGRAVSVTPYPSIYQLDNGRSLDGKSVINQPPETPIPPAPRIPPQAGEVESPPSRSFYTIAIIGDSLVDTMGEVLEYLDSALKNKYPQTKFLLYNYGTGAQNIEMGLARFSSHFKYQSRDYQSLPELKPDILIVASFSYNPFTPHDRDRHWLTLTQLVQEAKSTSSNVYMLAEIAPLRKDFGRGPQGVNWSDDTNYEHSGRIIEQLENAVGLSKSLGVPLIDAFTPSLVSSQKEGKRELVNPSDGIHPSVEGHQFMAEKIAQTLKFP